MNQVLWPEIVSPGSIRKSDESDVTISQGWMKANGKRIAPRSLTVLKVGFGPGQFNEVVEKLISPGPIKIVQT